MANIGKFIKIMNGIMGTATIGFGGFVLAKMFNWFLVNRLTLHLKDIPSWLMPFFFMLFGLLVLSTQFDIKVLKDNCQFINNKLGVFVFYTYLGSLMAYFADFARWRGDDFTEFVCICCALGYLILSVSMGLIMVCGEEKTNQKLGDLKQKITSD